MNLMPTENERLVEDLARKFSQTELAPGAAERDRAHSFPEAAMRKLAGLGLLTMLVPEEDGGAGIGPVGYALAVSQIAEACASTAVTMMVTNMVADSISRFGTTAQKQKYLPRFHDLVAASFSLSEPGAGSDAAKVA